MHRRRCAAIAAIACLSASVAPLTESLGLQTSDAQRYGFIAEASSSQGDKANRALRFTVRSP